MEPMAVCILISLFHQHKLFSVPGLSYTVEKAEITTGWSKPAVDERFNLGYISNTSFYGMLQGWR